MVTISTLARDYRQSRGITQEVVAKKIGISRNSYLAFESGKRELSVDEARKLANFFGVDFDTLTEGRAADYEKYQQMILSYLRLAGAKGMRKTKLAKLLYLADFAWFYTMLESMSGMQYRRIEYGPVPDAYFRAIDELEGRGKITIEREDRDDGGYAYKITESDGNRGQELSKISSGEYALMRDIFSKWEGKRATEIVNFTHEQFPYKFCRPDEIIPYNLIGMTDPDKLY